MTLIEPVGQARTECEGCGGYGYCGMWDDTLTDYIDDHECAVCGGEGWLYAEDGAA